MNPDPVVKPGEIVTWMGLAFETSDKVLVPRRETELLARTALDLLKTVEAAAPIRVIDMCCGAGNLACSLAHARPDIRVWASDLTDACVGLARKNVARHGLEERVDVCQGDLFSSLPDEKLADSVDLVVCNPPYISTGKLESESARLLDGQAAGGLRCGPLRPCDPPARDRGRHTIPETWSLARHGDWARPAASARAPLRAREAVRERAILVG